MKERLETVQKFFKLFGLREAFLRRGLTTADLTVDGKVLDDKEKLMMFVRVGSRSSINSRWKSELFPFQQHRSDYCK